MGVAVSGDGWRSRVFSCEKTMSSVSTGTSLSPVGQGSCTMVASLGRTGSLVVAWGTTSVVLGNNTKSTRPFRLSTFPLGASILMRTVLNSGFM